jgi:hypothetical protein
LIDRCVAFLPLNYESDGMAKHSRFGDPFWLQVWVKVWVKVWVPVWVPVWVLVWVPGWVPG